MQMSKELVDIITQHLSWVNNITNINRGGCGHVALALYEMFRKIGFKPQIYALYRNYEAENKYWALTTNNRRNNIRSAYTAAHYVVRVGTYFFDSGGAYSSLDDIPDFSDYHAKSIFKSDLVWALRYGCWNYAFRAYNNEETVCKIKSHILSFNQTLN